MLSSFSEAAALKRPAGCTASCCRGTATGAGNSASCGLAASVTLRESYLVYSPYIFLPLKSIPLYCNTLTSHTQLDCGGVQQKGQQELVNRRPWLWPAGTGISSHHSATSGSDCSAGGGRSILKPARSAITPPPGDQTPPQLRSGPAPTPPCRGWLVQWPAAPPATGAGACRAGESDERLGGWPGVVQAAAAPEAAGKGDLGAGQGGDGTVCLAGNEQQMLFTACRRRRAAGKPARALAQASQPFVCSQLPERPLCGSVHWGGGGVVVDLHEQPLHTARHRCTGVEVAQGFGLQGTTCARSAMGSTAVCHITHHHPQPTLSKPPNNTPTRACDGGNHIPQPPAGHAAALQRPPRRLLQRVGDIGGDRAAGVSHLHKVAGVHDQVCVAKHGPTLAHQHVGVACNRGREAMC